MSISVYNLIIPKGSTFKQAIRFRHTLKLTRDLIPSTTTPPTSLRVAPLPIALPSGYIISFPIAGSCETLDLVVDAAAAQGDTSITIFPYTATRRLRCGASAPILPRDLTGFVWRGAVRSAEDDVSPLLTFTFNTVDAASGSVEMVADAASTAAVPSNARFDQLPPFYEVPLSLQTAESFEDINVYNAAYFWDLEYEMPSGDVERKFYGRVWFPWEATR